MTERLLLLLLFIMPSHLSKLDQCDLCPPGTYFVKKCKNGFPHTTKCEPCPNGTYTEYHNRLKNCLRHTHCAGRNMVEHPGNATRRTLCICEEGYHMAFEFFKICLRNAECPPGTGVTEQGNGCKRCPRGFYSDKHSFKYSCRPWTNCAANGLAVIERGTRKSDVTCGPLNLTTVGLPNFANAKDLDVTEAISQPDISEDEHSLQTHEIIVMSLLSFLTTYSLVLSAFALWRRCKKCKNGQPRDRLERPDPEMDYANGCSTLPVQESYMGEIIFRQTAPVSCAPSLASLDVLPDVSTYLFDPHCSHEEQVGECSTLPKTQPKGAQTNWLSQGSLPSVQTTPAVLTNSTKLKSKSSEEYMQEMQKLIAEGYATVLSASAAEHLAAELGPSWRQVAKRLGVEEHQIDHIWNENRQDLERQILKMLSCWQRNKTGKATISELYGALLACNQDKLCKQLQTMENDLGTSEETKVFCT